MTPSFSLLLGDCLDFLRGMADDSIDSIVTDPPYHLTTGKKGGSGPASVNLNTPQGRAKTGTGFMGMTWDGGDIAFRPDVWRECLRVLKPGGHLLAFSGSRTYHRMVVAIEDAGFEIRDQIMWVYGSGFPKSMDVSKALDKSAGAERFITKTGCRRLPEDAGKFDSQASASRERRDAPATDAASQWQGWGTALKPAHEPICVARKPFPGPVAANVLEYGTGALNIDACRVPYVTVDDGSLATNPHLRKYISGGNGGNIISHEDQRRLVTPNIAGRWPANLIHDGSNEVIAAFPIAKGAQGAVGPQYGAKNSINTFGDYGPRCDMPPRNDAGSAARFFYCAKASRADREKDNTHPTVKPTALMRYLCRLVTPPGGIVLDPFMGSGSTGKAAILEGFGFVGMERDEAYYAIACARIDAASSSDKSAQDDPVQADLFGKEAA
jgi:DNA modification methylase